MAGVEQLHDLALGFDTTPCPKRHWKKMLYEFRRTPDAREASQAIVNKLASQRRPPAQRAKNAKPANRQQLSLFDEDGGEDR